MLGADNPSKEDEMAYGSVHHLARGVDGGFTSQPQELTFEVDTRLP